MKKPFLPTTNSVSPLTSTNQHSTEENSKQISKQYVSDYILSQPFNQTTRQNDEIETTTNRNGERRRLLPNTEQFRRSIQKEESLSDVSSSNDDDDEEEKIHLKNPRWSSTLREDFDDGKTIKDEILHSIGLTLDYRNSNVFIDDVRPGSVAANEQLQTGRNFFLFVRLIFDVFLGDRIVKWNGQILHHLSSSELDRIIEENSIDTADIDLTITRSTNRFDNLERQREREKKRNEIVINFFS